MIRFESPLSASLLRSALTTLVGLSLFVAGSSAHAERLKLDAEKSEITFVGSKPDGKHEGGFKKYKVDAEADFEDPSRSSLKIEIDTSSLWADDPRLANHLKSPDFFNVRKYPTITFESTEIVPKESETPAALIKGDLYMLGKKVAVDVPITAEVSEEAVVMKADFTIDRTRWGMDYGQGKINNDVK